MSKSVVIENVGPIESLEFQVPESGGVVVLTGRNGSGKTTALEAIGGVLGGKPELTPTDGEKKGTVDAFGATLKVQRRVSRSGELEVTSLDAGLTPAGLVDPGIKSPAAADAARIKAILHLLRATAGLDSFARILPDGMRLTELLDQADIPDDAIELATVVKRSLESAAREAEREAERENDRAAQKRKATEGIDLESLPDAAAAQERLEAAIEQQQKLRADSEKAAELRSAAEVAREKLAGLKDVPAFDQSTIDDSQAALEAAIVARDEADATVKRLESELAAARTVLEISREKLSAATTVCGNVKAQAAELLDAAESAAELRAELEDTIRRSEEFTAPTDLALLKAAEDVTAARKVCDQLAVAEKARADVEAAKEHRQAAKAAEKRGGTLRDAAKATDGVLSSIVADRVEGLSIRDGRLLVKTSRAEPVPFGELSHGERWKMAIDIAISAFEPGGDLLPVVTIPQEAWEGLDDDNRRIVHQHAKERNVLILTAECSTGDRVAATVLED